MNGVELDVASDEWDRELARLGGHPWQSALWGDVRRHVDGVIDHRWLVRRSNKIVQMVRFEERRIPALGRVAWITRGPVNQNTASVGLEADIRECLKDRKFVLAVSNPWCRNTFVSRNAGSVDKGPRTIWIDLTLGQGRLWQNLSKNFRRDIRLAHRHGVTVETTRDRQSVSEYFDLCSHISRMKGFELRESAEQMQSLLNHSSGEVEAQLFLARYEGGVAAGAFVLRCGQSVHYLTGASDRSYTKQCPGNALHWAIIEWALGRECRCYDLEGIDPKGNAGTYSFKKRMGGEEVTLAARQLEPINTTGRMLAPIARHVLNSQLEALASLARQFVLRTAREAR